MTNLNLSIRDDVYERMRKHSEIKWSEFVREKIEEKVNKLEKIDESEYVTSLSEELLYKDWNNKEDERWNEYV